MECWNILFAILIGVIGIHYIFRRLNYFKRHGVLHVPPLLIFGGTSAAIFRRIAFTDYLQKLYYFKPSAKYFGFYITTQPIILLRDPELIKEVFIKNFEVFPNRRGLGEFNDILFSKNLFSLRGQKWRDVRTLLSPAFTSNKMKTMFVLMSECAVNFSNALSEMSVDKKEIDMKDVFSKYTNDVIATCAFGVKVDSMKDSTNNFYFHGEEATSFFSTSAFKFFFITIFPNLAKFFGLKMLSDSVTNFFKDIWTFSVPNFIYKHI